MDSARINKILKKLKTEFSGDKVTKVISKPGRLGIRIISEKFEGISKTTRYKQLAELCRKEVMNSSLLLSFEAWTKLEFEQLQKSTDSKSQSGSSGSGQSFSGSEGMVASG